MSFTLTYNTMVSNDIKHMYSSGGRIAPGARDRSRDAERSLIELRRMKHMHQMKLNMITHTIPGVTNPRENLPRAPAFSAMSRQEVGEVVQRLSRPTVASRGLSRESEGLAMKDARKTPRFLGTRSYSSEDLSHIVQRLRMPTTTVELRQRQKFHEV